MKKSQEVITLPDFDIRTIEVKVRGTNPLIVNKFSEKAKAMMLEKQMQKGSKGKVAKNPEEQYLNSLYMFKDGKRTGFPAVGFKAAMVRGAKQVKIAMTDARAAFHVIADEGDLVEIKGKHTMRDDMVRLATGVADVRFRGEYVDWESKVRIKYNNGVLSADQIVTILSVAGFACGIGEWRPEKSNSGSFGTWEIVN